jgi:hypothetical protein
LAGRDKERAVEDKRGAHRSRTFLKADISINGGLSALSCIIKDLSDTGARIVLSAGVVLPETFRLHLPKPDRWVDATVRWRRGEYVGVHFMQEEASLADQGETPQGAAERIRYLEGEVNRLRRMLEELRADPTKLHQILDQAA